MRVKLVQLAAVFACCILTGFVLLAQRTVDRIISPTQPVPSGQAPGKQFKLVKNSPYEKWRKLDEYGQDY